MILPSLDACYLEAVLESRAEHQHVGEVGSMNPCLLDLQQLHAVVHLPLFRGIALYVCVVAILKFQNPVISWLYAFAPYHACDLH